MYKYELHCHTGTTSACGTMSADEIVDLYLANDYDGIVVTDHLYARHGRVQTEGRHEVYDKPHV